MKALQWFVLAVAVSAAWADAAASDDLLGRSRSSESGGYQQERSRVDERSRSRDSNERAQPPIQDRTRGEDRARIGDRERTLPPLQDRQRGSDPGGRTQPPIQDRTRGEDRARIGDRERTLPPLQDRQRGSDPGGRTQPPILDRARGEDRARVGDRERTLPPLQDRQRGPDPGGRAQPPVQDRARGEDTVRRDRDGNAADGPPRVIVGPYGVVDPSARDRGDLLSRTRDNGSRSVYGTVTNARANVVDIREIPATGYRRAPIDLFKGPLDHQARRESVEIRAPNLRIGYVHYDSRWRDDDFFYAFYEFRPLPGRCTVSPWYYYPHLPGYIRVGRVVILQPVIAIYSVNDRYYYPWRDAPIYVWSRPVWVSDRYRAGDVDWALDDIVSMFERRDRRALERLVPRFGRVGVWIDEDYAYSLGPDDFYDLLLDNAFGTRTRRYDILEVRRWRDQVRVLARHDYEDPWGRIDSVYHTYRLEWQSGRYVIVDFGTSSFRPRI